MQKSPSQYGRFDIYEGAINYFYSKLHLRWWQAIRICLRHLKGNLNKESLCLFQNLNQNVFLNIPLRVVKNCRWQSVLKKTICTFSVCFATLYLISISALENRGSRFVIKSKWIKATKTKPETTQNCLKVRKCSCNGSWTEKLWKY